MQEESIVRAINAAKPVFVYYEKGNPIPGWEEIERVVANIGSPVSNVSARKITILIINKTDKEKRVRETIAFPFEYLEVFWKEDDTEHFLIDIESTPLILSFYVDKQALRWSRSFRTQQWNEQYDDSKYTLRAEAINALEVRYEDMYSEKRYGTYLIGRSERQVSELLLAQEYRVVKKNDSYELYFRDQEKPIASGENGEAFLKQILTLDLKWEANN